MSHAAAPTDPPDPALARAALFAGGEVDRSTWSEMVGMLPDVGRLLRGLVTDPRVPVRAKVLAGAATVYVAAPVDTLPGVVRGTHIGIDDLVVVLWAVRRLVADAGYDVVRDLWTGTDAGFVLLMLFTGVDR